MTRIERLSRLLVCPESWRELLSQEFSSPWRKSREAAQRRFGASARREEESMRDISDDEQRSDRAKSTLPKGLRRCSRRGPRDFRHGLLRDCHDGFDGTQT